VGALIGKIPLRRKWPSRREAVFAEMTGMKSAQSWISRRILSSQTSPPRSLKDAREALAKQKT